MCEYKFRNGEICKEEALPNSNYCILHIDLPEGEGSEEFKKINKLKEEKVKEKVDNGDFNFEGAKLFEIDFTSMVIEGNVNFDDVDIKKDATFDGAKIGGGASFDGAKIGGGASFRGAKIGGDAFFKGALIGGDAFFKGAFIGGNAFFKGAFIGGNATFEVAKIGGDASFEVAKIGGDASFVEAKIGGDASFDGAEIGGDAWFRGAKIGGDASFVEAKIGGDASFDEAKIGKYLKFEQTRIGGEECFHFTGIEMNLSFYKTKFRIPKTQEEIYRQIRKNCEDLRLREDADYYFYREMEAKRKQKYRNLEFFGRVRQIYWGFWELPIQYIFGYGVRPFLIIRTWLVTVISLAFVYWYGNGIIIEENVLWWERIILSLYFSILTAATPGYGGYKPTLGLYQGLASFEAILGTFMWGAFIAAFARKYMR